MLNEARELAGATFRPDLSPSRQREGEEYEVKRHIAAATKLCAKTYQHYSSAVHIRCF